MESHPVCSSPPRIELDNWEQLDDRTRWDRSQYSNQSTSRNTQTNAINSAPQSSIPISLPTPLLDHSQSINPAYQRTSAPVQNLGDVPLYLNMPTSLSTQYGPMSQLTSLQQPGLTLSSYQNSALTFPLMPVQRQIVNDPSACFFNCGYPPISASFPLPLPQNSNSTGPHPLLSSQSQLIQPVFCLPTAVPNLSNTADFTQVHSALDTQTLISSFAALSTRQNPSNTILASNNQPAAPAALLPTPTTKTAFESSISKQTSSGQMQQQALTIRSLPINSESGVAQKASLQQATKPSVNQPKPLILPAENVITSGTTTTEKEPQSYRASGGIGGVPFIPRLERQRQMQAQQREAKRRTDVTQLPQSTSKGSNNNNSGNKFSSDGGGGGSTSRRPHFLLPTPPGNSSASTSSADHEISPAECSTPEFLPSGRIRILRRGDLSSADHNASSTGDSRCGAVATVSTNGGAIKTLEQREAEYNQLKERLFSDCRCGECSWCACDRSTSDGPTMTEELKQSDVHGGQPSEYGIQTPGSASTQAQQKFGELRANNETGAQARILPRSKS